MTIGVAINSLKSVVFARGCRSDVALPQIALDRFALSASGFAVAAGSGIEHAQACAGGNRGPGFGMRARSVGKLDDRRRAAPAAEKAEGRMIAAVGQER